MTVTISSDSLSRFAEQIFVAAGVEPTIATQMADVLIWANLRGTDTHGVRRIPRYLSLLERGATNGAPNMRIERDAGAIAVLEADQAPGGAAMLRAVEEAVERAGKFNIAWCAARNITHAGAIGYFASKVAEAGFAGIVMSASGKPLMAYHGARVSGVSTNPLAVSIPRHKRRPFVLDISTSNVSFGKLLSAREQKADIPLDWGLDKNGSQTTDPDAVETLTPLGGPKGSGLSLMIECLASVAVGNPLISRWLSGDKPEGGPTFNGIVIAVNLAALGDPQNLERDIEYLAEQIKSLPKTDDTQHIFLPGERGDSVMDIRERDGIPLPDKVWEQLEAVAVKLDVKVPVSMDKSEG